ncbi:MAG: Fic family protein [Chloroflexota bacterium]|nr:Fic family protein [Chloroflexota bacterium]
MTGVRGGDRQPGQFRTIQDFISHGGGGIESARFVPPGPMDLDRVLSDVERYVGRPHELLLLVWLALVQYQFETIHPFEDGNGRIGRLLISLLLVERQAVSQPLLSLSAFFERNRSPTTISSSA